MATTHRVLWERPGGTSLSGLRRKLHPSREVGDAEGRGNRFAKPRRVGEAEQGWKEELRKKLSRCLYARSWNAIPSWDEQLAFASKGTAIKVSQADVVQSLSHVRLCGFMDCSPPGFPVHYYLLHYLRLVSIESVMRPTISSSVAPFSSSPQSFPASGSFPVTWLWCCFRKITTASPTGEATGVGRDPRRCVGRQLRSQTKKIGSRNRLNTTEMERNVQRTVASGSGRVCNVSVVGEMRTVEADFQGSSLSSQKGGGVIPWGTKYTKKSRWRQGTKMDQVESPIGHRAHEVWQNLSETGRSLDGETQVAWPSPRTGPSLQGYIQIFSSCAA